MSEFELVLFRHVPSFLIDDGAGGLMIDEFVNSTVNSCNSTTKMINLLFDFQYLLWPSYVHYVSQTFFVICIF
jgi:hypothetical protein